MANDNKNQGAIRSPVTADELPPHLKGRIKGLVYDLSNDDLPMALLDLAHLYRALRTGATGPVQGVKHTEDLTTLIFTEDRTAIEEVCPGPDNHGTCPQAESGMPAACADRWIMSKGWEFKVAPDAATCPVISLGLAHGYLRAAIEDEENSKAR